MSDIRDLLSKELQEELQESFAFATGFGVVFVDQDIIRTSSWFCT